MIVAVVKGRKKFFVVSGAAQLNPSITTQRAKSYAGAEALLWILLMVVAGWEQEVKQARAGQVGSSSSSCRPPVVKATDTLCRPPEIDKMRRKQRISTTDTMHDHRFEAA